MSVENVKLSMENSSYGEDVNSNGEISKKFFDLMQAVVKKLNHYERILGSNEELRLNILEKKIIDTAIVLDHVETIKSKAYKEHDLTETSWRILLDLYISESDKRLVSVTDGFLAARNAATTSLRHIKLLEENGYLYRTEDEDDRRRTFIALTDVGKSVAYGIIKRVVGIID